MPFLKNVWYVAANADDLGETLVARRICDEPIVMFRTASGEVAALEDKCPHRFVPLSMGRRVGDSIQCGYHGLRFDAHGACVENPNDPGRASPKACVRTYPTVERHGVVWLWPGDAERATPDTIPDFAFLDDLRRFRVQHGYSYMRANYELLSDNLLDLSHVHYLHPGAHVGTGFAAYRNEVRQDGETIWSMLWRPTYHLNEQRRKLYGFASGEVEGQGHTRWDAPGVLLVHTAFWEHGQTIEDGVQLPSLHFLTPETEYTTHYFWATARTHCLDDDHADPMGLETVKRIFETEDGPMIEAQQARMGKTTDFLEQSPLILKADAAGVMARRLMKRKIREEQAAASEATAVPVG